MKFILKLMQNDAHFVLTCLSACYAESDGEGFYDEYGVTTGEAQLIVDKLIKTLKYAVKLSVEKKK